MNRSVQVQPASEQDNRTLFINRKNSFERFLETRVINYRRWWSLLRRVPDYYSSSIFTKVFPVIKCVNALFVFSFIDSKENEFGSALKELVQGWKDFAWNLHGISRSIIFFSTLIRKLLIVTVSKACRGMGRGWNFTLQSVGEFYFFFHL